MSEEISAPICARDGDAQRYVGRKAHMITFERI
jgi:hypothetical protein